MHNNGLFNARYGKDGIAVPGRSPIIHSSFSQFLQNMSKRIPVVPKPEGFLRMSQSHIELLHHLHHTIQRIHYGQKRSYSYKSAKKRIEWRRMLIGE